jgi:predicted amidohydrolase
MINRRRFNQWLALALAAGALPGLARSGTQIPHGRRTLRVAAIQMVPRLGDVAANLEQAERLIRQAQRQGAEWIALPELFTSAAAFHPDMLRAIQPFDGEPARLLRRLAQQGNSVIGGSFLASRSGDSYNRFLLAFPDGNVSWHDKDFPSFWENCITRGGGDGGVLPTPIGDVGSALCWELLRSGTARRLFGKVKLVIGGSCWWTLPESAGADHPLRATNLTMLKEAPARFARMLGVPVIHGSHAGPFSGYWSPDLPDVPYDSTYLGEAVVVDANGSVLARRTLEEGAGIACAEITLAAEPVLSEPIPESFWIPEEMPEAWKASWKRWLDTGSHYYRTVTKPFLDTGEIREYVPEFMQ